MQGGRNTLIEKICKNLNFNEYLWSESHILLTFQLYTYNFHSTPTTDIHLNLNFFISVYTGNFPFPPTHFYSPIYVGKGVEF